MGAFFNSFCESGFNILDASYRYWDETNPEGLSGELLVFHIFFRP